MIYSAKYFFLFFFISAIIVNCEQTDSVPQHMLQRSHAPIVKRQVDSVKYRAEIYRLDTLFENLYNANAFNGNVLIAKGREIIYQKSFGYAIKETNRLLDDSSLFQLASVSKVVTALGILLLHEQGMLKLSDQVSSILKGFPYKGITIQHLLSHRSGLPNYTYFCSELMDDKNELLSNQNILDVMMKHQPKSYYQAGLRFNYSNTNYVLLALIIEKITHKTYEDYVTEHIFAPIGMKHSITHLTKNRHNTHFTKGYTVSFKPIAEDRFDGVVGDKGIYTTTYDLFLLSAALYQQTILHPATQKLAYTPYSPEKKKSNYGLGWRMKHMTDDDKEVFHNGWWHGYRTAFHRRLRDSLTIIVLSNRLNRSVYSTGRIYDAIDGLQANKNLLELAEE